jgi:hypothetical protein
VIKRLLALVAVAAMVGAGFVVRSLFDTAGDGPGSTPVAVPMLCAEEIAKFCDETVAAFAETDPKVDGRPVRVELTSLDSVTAAKRIADGTENPLVWIPASTAWIDEVNAASRTDGGGDIFYETGEYQALPIAESPTVLVGPRERIDVLTARCGGALTWPCIRDATIENGGWTTIGGNPAWGLVKVGYANPTTTNTGLLALILMSYGYWDRPTGLTPAEIADPGYVQFVRDIGVSVTAFADSSPDYARDIVNRCPSFYDIALTYESVAATSVRNAVGRGCDLAIAYPTINVKSDFPFAIAVTDDTTAEQKDAAVALRDFFYAPESQERALALGLRPANPDVPIVGTTGNPLADNQAAGIELVLPRSEVADFPDFDTTAAMLQTWRQKVEPR